MSTEQEIARLKEALDELTETKAWRERLSEETGNIVCDVMRQWLEHLEGQADRDVALEGLLIIKGYAAETYAHWDADEDAKVGKRLSALAGVEGYNYQLDKGYAAIRKALLPHATPNGGNDDE